ncbi:MAG: dual specificity protein phosphatase family protein [Pirellulales bacterium]
MHPTISRILFWPTYTWNLLLGRVLRLRPWWSHVEDQILLGARPSGGDAKRLSKLGVTGVINMCQEYPGPKRQYESLGIEQLWLPTVDFNPPTLEYVRMGVDFIHRKLEEGGKVYIHCKAGRARSATVLLCYLVKHRGMTPEEAQAFLLSKRPHISKNLVERPVVQAFAKECG